MFDVGFIERYGAGIRMMQRLCREWGNKAPRYEFHPIETKIIFDSPIQESTYVEIDDISEQLNERQKNALFHIQKNRQITRKEYVQINHVSNTTAYEELRDMADKSLLDVKGKGRGTKYIQKERLGERLGERLSKRLLQGAGSTCQNKRTTALPR